LGNAGGYGGETDGISKEVLVTVDVIAEIPVWGVNKSLNVIVSTVIAVYTLMGKAD
jgi:tRNA G18 (ribose-2'-O)-methylase SpoU